MAAFNKDKENFTSEYRRQMRDKGEVPYSAPFKLATVETTGDVKNGVDRLFELAEQIQVHRKDRNELVHEVASIATQRSLELMRLQRHIAKERYGRAVSTPR